MIKHVAKQVKDQNIQSNPHEAPTVANERPRNSKSYTLLLSCTRQKGEHLIRSLEKDIHGTLPENFQTTICYTGIKFGAKYDKIKNTVKKSQQHDVVYYATCLEPGFVEDYTNEAVRRLNERVTNHNGETKSHIFINTRMTVIIPVLH